MSEAMDRWNNFAAENWTNPAVELAEAALQALKESPGPASDSQCDRCQLDASVRADKAEADSAELRSKNLQLDHDLAKFPPRRERIAELEAKNERMKCCGNCATRHDSPPRISWDGHECGVFRLLDDDVWRDDENWPMVKCSDSCHFTPARWTARAEEGIGDE